MIKLTEFQKEFDLNKNIEQLFELYHVNTSELSDIEILKKVFHAYYAPCSSCANLQLILETLPHSSSEMQLAVTLLKQ